MPNRDLHSADTAALPVLYSFRRCPYAIRARLALAVSTTPHCLHEVDLSHKPAALLIASPKGTVPVLVLSAGGVIDESLAIMRWSLAQHDPQHWLRPAGASLDAMLALITDNDHSFKPNLDRYKYPHRYPQENAGDPATFAAHHRAAGAEWLSAVAGHLNHTIDGRWLFGQHACLADMAILPFVRQFAHTDAAWFASQPWPRLQQWLAEFEASELFNGVMQKPANRAFPPESSA